VVKSNGVFYDIQRFAKKFDIYVVRISKGSEHYSSSMPCQNCVKTLKKYGFKNIYYSIGDGGFKKVKIRDMDSDHLSNAQNNLERFISHKHRC
jgi:deoxycytidylate deaminase